LAVVSVFGGSVVSGGFSAGAGVSGGFSAGFGVSDPQAARPATSANTIINFFMRAAP
jgi:hypothetical protein